MTSLLLGLLAVSLAGPTPALLAGSVRTRRTPRAAMLLWQGIALAAGLAALGAGLSLATDQAWRREPGTVGTLTATLAVVLTGVLLARLTLSAHRVGTSLRTRRRRHRERLELIGRNLEGVMVLDHELPVAYCLPGGNRSRVVVSAGALVRLGGDEVAAVVAHERAHLRARHDLALEAFSVLHHAFPRWVSSRAALAEVRLLVEVLADRVAARAAGATPLARALVALADGRPPSGALGAGGQDLVERVRLLSDEKPHPLQAGLLVVAAVAVVALPTAFLGLPWLLSLR